MAPKRPMAERFWAKVGPPTATGCREWMAFRNPLGYGMFGVQTKVVRLAHRVAYELAYGAVPDGLEIDHLCRNPACVNSEHLEAVTHRVNVLRGTSPHAESARRHQIHCKRGHPLDDAYDYGKGRSCRTCKAERQAAIYAERQDEIRAKARARYAELRDEDRLRKRGESPARG